MARGAPKNRQALTSIDMDGEWPVSAWVFILLLLPDYQYPIDSYEHSAALRFPSSRQNVQRFCCRCALQHGPRHNYIQLWCKQFSGPRPNESSGDSRMLPSAMFVEPYNLGREYHGDKHKFDIFGS